MYVPFGTSANDYYGGHRHGDNLFGEALVCLDARTGKRMGVREADLIDLTPALRAQALPIGGANITEELIALTLP